MRSHNNERSMDAFAVEIDNLHKSDDEIRSTMEQGFSKMDNQLRIIASNQSKSQRTDWQALAVLLTFVGMVGTLVWLPIQHRLNAMEQHANKDGHPETVLLEIENLRTKLEVQSTYHERMVSLQLSALAAGVEGRIQNSEERIDRIDFYGSRKWMVGHGLPASGEKLPD